jgi:hypothetical protein
MINNQQSADADKERRRDPWLIAVLDGKSEKMSFPGSENKN